MKQQYIKCSCGALIPLEKKDIINEYSYTLNFRISLDHDSIKNKYIKTIIPKKKFLWWIIRKERGKNEISEVINADVMLKIDITEVKNTFFKTQCLKCGEVEHNLKSSIAHEESQKISLGSVNVYEYYIHNEEYLYSKLPEKTKDMLYKNFKIDGNSWNTIYCDPKYNYIKLSKNKFNKLVKIMKKDASIDEISKILKNASL